MAGEAHLVSAGQAQAQRTDLLLQETIHRGSNDLQMIVGLLTLQSRRAKDPEARQALDDAVDRISVLARARADMSQSRPQSLETALKQVCTALQSQAELRSIDIILDVEKETVGLSAPQITALALVVNELSTNAIKHAFEEDKGGHITVKQSTDASGCISVHIDDDGLPFPDPKHPGTDGLGLGLSKRLMASIGGLFIAPRPGSKVFELRVPSASNA